MERLEYVAKQLLELIKLAQEEGDHLLVYLLEVAVAECHDEINKRHRRSRSRT